MSADSPGGNDDLKCYALFQRQYVFSRVVGFYLKRGGQGAAELNNRKGLGMERPSDSAGLFHKL
jgi:hypothetical protein